ncbi:hypothetical protein [Streptomyces sp. NPDC002573]|uniref:hypothetical protein n=1 Tax=Streptomyces sp. NPDC002573 TaxID=3364651 RepID=UPI003674D376
MEAELAETRNLLLTDLQDEDATAADSAEEWSMRFRPLLATRPDLVDDLRRVLATDLAPTHPVPPHGTSTVFNATASGHALVCQSAGKQTINER